MKFAPDYVACVLNDVFEDADKTLAAAHATAAEIAANPPLAVYGVKDVLDQQRTSAVSENLRYVAAWNDYSRTTLRFPAEDGFKIFAPVFPAWDMAHQAPGMPMPFTGQTTNVMLDLATVMKQNPNLKVLNTGGYQTASFIRDGIESGAFDGVGRELRGILQRKLNLNRSSRISFR